MPSLNLFHKAGVYRADFLKVCWRLRHRSCAGCTEQSEAYLDAYSLSRLVCPGCCQLSVDRNDVAIAHAGVHKRVVHRIGDNRMIEALRHVGDQRAERGQAAAVKRIKLVCQ